MEFRRVLFRSIDATAIEAVARELIEAPSAAVHISTGVNQSRQGLLCFWLSEMINFVTGNLGRKGGTHKPDGLLNHYPPAGGTQHIETSMGDRKSTRLNSSH